MRVVVFVAEVLAQSGGVTSGEVVDFLTVPVLFFVFGFATGFTTAELARNRGQSDMKHTVALLITLSWFLSMLASVAVPAYQTSVFVHAIMGAVAGYLFQKEDGSVTVPGMGTYGGENSNETSDTNGGNES